MKDRGTRAMQLLAVRLIKKRDPNDAIVLGDAMLEHGISGLITGRSRPVTWRTFRSRAPLPDLRNVTTAHELEIIARTRAELPRFVQQSFEAIYNVQSFAAEPTAKNWNKIWTHWFTPPRGTYRALLASRLLPRTIRLHEIDWETSFSGSDVFLSDVFLHGIIGTTEDVLLANQLNLVRVPRRRKLTTRTLMFNIERLAQDNPQTSERHFDEEAELFT